MFLFRKVIDIPVELDIQLFGNDAESRQALLAINDPDIIFTG